MREVCDFVTFVTFVTFLLKVGLIFMMLVKPTAEFFDLVFENVSTISQDSFWDFLRLIWEKKIF